MLRTATPPSSSSLQARTRNAGQLLIQGGKCAGTGGLVDRIPLAGLPEAGPRRSKPSSSCTARSGYCIHSKIHGSELQHGRT